MTEDSRGERSHYQFMIEGLLDDHWHDWFEGLSVMSTSEGNTVLSGPIRDQADLHGVLKKINNLGLRLISVNPARPD